MAEWMEKEKIMILGGAALILLVFGLVTTRMFLRTARFPYRARPLLTKREYSFYLLLQREAARRGLLVCPKVGMKDLMEVTSRRNFPKYFRMISQKHVDFVVCDRDLCVLFAVELDDSSHDTEESQRRDEFKNRAFRAAKIPLKRIRKFDEYAVRELFRGA